MIDQINKILKVLAINRQISIGGKKTKATTIQKVFPDLGGWTKCFTHAIQCISTGQYFHGNVSLYFYPQQKPSWVLIHLLNTSKYCDNTCKYCGNTHEY